MAQASSSRVCRTEGVEEGRGLAELTFAEAIGARLAAAVVSVVGGLVLGPLVIAKILARQAVYSTSPPWRLLLRGIRVDANYHRFSGLW